jgi:heavy metal translocating P-type ATPase
MTISGKKRLAAPPSTRRGRGYSARMWLPRSDQVPVTAALSGPVVLIGLTSAGVWWIVLGLFGAWGVTCLVELWVRNAAAVGPLLRLPEVRAALISSSLLVLSVLAPLVHASNRVAWVLNAGCYVTAGWGPARTGLRAARQRKIDVELLMVVAALCAAGTGQAFDGALLFVIFATSRAIAAIATRRTQDSVSSLLTLAPDHAVKIVPGGGEEQVAAGCLAVGDLLLVRPGDRIAADGVVESGVSEVDQASITGEPLPAPKSPGAEVFAGTVNGVGMLRVRVTRAGGESVVARIAALVEQASATKSKTQQRLDDLEQRYSAGVVLVTGTIMLLPFLLGTPFEPSLLRAMAFMIVASPCALTLATMPALLAAIANAGRHGVLVKGAAVMERLGKTTTVVFDKTGTLTVGAPRLVRVIALPGSGFDADEILRLAAAAERASEHPVAAAITGEAAAKGLRLPEVLDFRAEPGRGVRANVAGRCVVVESAAGGPEIAGRRTAAVRNFESAGYTVLLVAVDAVPSGILALTDGIRPDAATTIDRLAAVIDDQPVVLTGDGLAAALRTAEQVHIRDVRAPLLPGQKADAIAELQARGKRVMYVGDGINDAPALTTADVGLAMAHGADLALETSDVVVVSEDLAVVPALISMSRRAHAVMVQNLLLAATVIAALVSIDLIATLPLPAAVAGHEGSTLVVALNGLRLLSARSWRGHRVARRPLTRAELRRRVVIAASFLVLGLYARYQLSS